MESSKLSNTGHQSEVNRNQGDRIGALEQDMHTVKHRLDRFERQHDDLPVRVNRLEMIAQNQSKLLEDIDAAVKRMGHKITLGLGGAAVLIALINIFAPHIIRGLIS